MSSILASAGARLSGRTDAPLDLSWSKNHTCDHFINTEDLRPEACAPQSDGDTSVLSSISSDDEFNKTPSHQETTTRSWYIHPAFYQVPSSSHVIAAQAESDDSVDITKCKSEASSPVRNDNPFSIDSILGIDSSESCDDEVRESEPAQVFSPYMYMSAISSYSMYSRVTCVSLGGSTQPLITSTPSTGEDTKCLDLANYIFWCHVCNIVCSDRMDAERHQIIHRYRGDKCSLKRLLYSEHGYVSRHEQTGYLDRIQCGLCDKVVANCFFIKHLSLHDGHICDVCDHEFSTNSKLQDHMNIHSRRFLFSCKVCDRQFSKKSSLTQHMRYHREYKQFVCRFCSKSFSSKYTCTVHERIHTGENPYKCEKPGCDRSFPQKIQMKLHMATHRKRGEL